MDITVTARHRHVSQSLREHIDSKLAKIEQVHPRTRSIDVVVTHEPNPRQAKSSERVELTCRASGPVIRAEATHDDSFAAFDAAYERLLERLRRMHDRRKVRRGQRNVPSVDLGGEPVTGTIEVEATAQRDSRFGDSPVEVREKVHISSPMNLEQALNEMELVGHDFYLFHDSETDRPAVVYRRRGWSYGVIQLEAQERGELAS